MWNSPELTLEEMHNKIVHKSWYDYHLCCSSLGNSSHQVGTDPIPSGSQAPHGGVRMPVICKRTLLVGGRRLWQLPPSLQLERLLHTQQEQHVAHICWICKTIIHYVLFACCPRKNVRHS